MKPSSTVCIKEFLPLIHNTHARGCRLAQTTSNNALQLHYEDGQHQWQFPFSSTKPMPRIDYWPFHYAQTNSVGVEYGRILTAAQSFVFSWYFQQGTNMPSYFNGIQIMVRITETLSISILQIEVVDFSSCIHFRINQQHFKFIPNFNKTNLKRSPVTALFVPTVLNRTYVLQWFTAYYFVFLKISYWFLYWLFN